MKHEPIQNPDKSILQLITEFSIRIFQDPVTVQDQPIISKLVDDIKAKLKQATFKDLDKLKSRRKEFQYIIEAFGEKQKQEAARARIGDYLSSLLGGVVGATGGYALGKTITTTAVFGGLGLFIGRASSKILGDFTNPNLTLTQIESMLQTIQTALDDAITHLETDCIKQPVSSTDTSGGICQRRYTLTN